MNMYSNNQWSFNPAVYQNIPYEQVDWASLAQQWIKMKETLPNTNQGPPPPPAPQISKPTTTEPTPPPTPTASVAHSNDIEGGEAPMDMDTKDDDAATSVGVAPSGNWNQWGNWQSQWGWGWSANAGTVPSAETTQSATASVDSKVKSQNNDSIPVLNDVRTFPIIGNTGTCTPQVPSSFNYNNSGGGMIPPIHPKTNYNFDSSFTPIPSKSSVDNWSKSKTSNRQAPQKPIPTEQFAVMDAAKKKQLPAWIREGLNKMEREKQKKQEKERMIQEKMFYDQMRPETKEPEPNPSPIFAEVPPPNELPVTPDYARKSPDIVSRPKRRSPNVETSRQRSRLDATASRKTKDQIMEESMLKVRRILTELLLEATEKQVQLIAKEEHRRFRASASAQPIRKSNALTSLTGNLGLDVYDSDDNSSDGDRDNHNNDVDSDEELQMVIEKKKRDFTLVEDEIERLIEDHEIKERLIAQQDAKDEDDNDDDGNEDDEEDESRNRNNRDRDTNTPHQRHAEHGKERPPPADRSDSKPSDDSYHRVKRREEPASEIKQLNGDSKPPLEPEKQPPRPQKKKSKSASRSSSSSSSSASASSSSSGDTSSSESTSSKSDDHSTGSSGRSKKKSKKSKSRKNSDKKSERGSKKRRDSSDSDSAKRNSSRSRYHDKYKRSKNSDSVERKRRRRSPSYHRRSPSYHKSSRREHSSKYKDSPSSSSSRTRRRDYSRESKRSRYRSSSRESKYKRR